MQTTSSTRKIKNKPAFEYQRRILIVPDRYLKSGNDRSQQNFQVYSVHSHIVGRADKGWHRVTELIAFSS